ncbi:MAG: hypothetical protein OES46_18420 [Gammaproteobacteria bacterium]|nr:hypothetical protein [Gammaproteobacteria bacterium]
MTRVVGLCGCVLASVAIAFGTMARAETLAGTLKEMQGKALVNAGNGYESAQPGMLLKLGDRVLTLQGGSTVIAQVDGCVTRLAENTAFTLQQPSMCNGGVNTLRQIGPYYAQAIGAPQPGETETDVPPEVPARAPEGAEPEAEPEAAAEEPTAVAAEEPAPGAKKPKKKKKGLWWGVGIAALLAAGGGGGGGSSSSTPAH